jgi:hypothetical protein
MKVEEAVMASARLALGSRLKAVRKEGVMSPATAWMCTLTLSGLAGLEVMEISRLP